MTITLEKTKGYEIGKNSGKTWIAEITRDGREFAETSDIDYGEDRHWFRRNRATRHDTYEIVKNGLYEVCELGERHYRVVFTKADGTSGWMQIDTDRAEKMTALIEEGSDSEEARIATKL
jgi:hypothetical protein